MRVFPRPWNTSLHAKDANGDAITKVYAEAEFYDLAFSTLIEEKAFDAVSARAAMTYALKNTDWLVGTVGVNTYRTWTNTDDNALSMLRIRVKAITVRLCISDCSGRIWFTDVLLQDGSIATGWVGNPSEIRWTLDG